MTKQLGAWPVPRVNKFSGEGQWKINHAVVYEVKNNTIDKEKSSDKWEGYTKWGGWQRNKKMDDMEDTVVTIRRKYLDNFEGQSMVSTGWFNPDNEWLKRDFSTLEPELYIYIWKGYWGSRYCNI